MGFLGFESKCEKELRLLKMDLYNIRIQEESIKNDIPRFGLKYADDYRKESEKLK